jgi:hypothetical protein
MKALLLEAMPEFTRGLTSKLLTYALGRGVESYDRAAVRAIVADTAAHEYRLQAMVQSIAKSFPFQHRRGEHVNAAGLQAGSR